MRIYTSYFARARQLPEGIVPVSISLWPPRDYSGARTQLLAPSQDILKEYKAEPDWQRYVDRFNGEILAKRDPAGIIAALGRISGGKDVCLLCFERDPSQCHRSLVAGWLKANGADVAGEYAG